MDNLCRVCIKKAAKWTSLNTQIENPPSLSFLDFLNKYMSLNACETDKLPQSLCSICTRIIKTFYTFVKLAEKSDTILRESFENSVATGTHNDNGGISSEELIIGNEKIEEELEDFNKEDSFHCHTRENSTESSLYILDIVKEEPRVSESTSIVHFKDTEINESYKFPSNLDHPEGSVEELDDVFSCTNSDLASVGAEHTDFEVDIPISFLKRGLIKTEDETDSQSNCLSKPHCINSNLKKKAGKIKAKSKEVEVIREKDSNHGNRKQVSSKVIEACDKEFNSRSLTVHKKRHSELKTFECETCSKNFTTKKYRDFHMESHKGVIIKCDQCDKEFNNSYTLRIHMKLHTEPKSVECEKCCKKFSSKSYLNVHMENHKKCDLCDIEFNNSRTLRMHMEWHTEPKSVECETCGKKFSSKQNLNIHMENHKGIRKKCDQCDKEFNNSHNLRMHMNWHTEPKSVECETCGKKFSSKQSLNIHMEYHKGIRRKCDQCDKEFTRSTSLRRHMEWHNNPKPFKCDNCGKSFSTKHSLTSHIKVCKGGNLVNHEKKHECEI